MKCGLEGKILIAIFFALVIVSTGSAVSDSNLVVELTLDNSCPPQDTSGNNKDFGCVNSPATGNSGAFGTAYDLGSNAYLDRSDDDDLDFDTAGAFSFSVWAKTTATTQDQVLISKWQSSNNYIFKLSPAAGDQIGLWAGGSNCGNFATFANWNDGNWHHYVVTYDGSDLKYYVDGSLLLDTTCNNGFANTGDPVYIGQRGSNHFDGSLDQVRLFNDILTSSEVSSLYTNDTLGSGNSSGGVTADYSDDFSDGALNNWTILRNTNNSWSVAEQNGRLEVKTTASSTNLPLVLQYNGAYPNASKKVNASLDAYANETAGNLHFDLKLSHPNAKVDTRVVNNKSYGYLQWYPDGGQQIWRVYNTTGDRLQFSSASYSAGTWHTENLISYSSNFTGVWDGGTSRTLSNDVSGDSAIRLSFNPGHNGGSKSFFIDDFKLSAANYTGWENLSNKNPVIGSVSTTPNTWSKGDTPDFTVDCSDPDGYCTGVNITVKENGTEIVSDLKLTNSTGSNWVVSDAFTADTDGVWYNATIEAMDDNGSVASQEVNQYIDEVVAVSITNLNSPRTTDYADARLILNVTLNDTATAIKYNIDGNSNITACTKCKKHLHNITAFEELSSGQHTFNLYAEATNTDSKSVVFTYHDNITKIPEYPYESWNLVLNLHDVAHDSSEAIDVEKVYNNTFSYTGGDPGPERKWNSLRFTWNVYVNWSGTYPNATSTNASNFREFYYKYSWKNETSNGPFEFAYHNDAPSAFQVSVSDGNADWDFYRKAWIDAYGEPAYSNVQGFRGWDYPYLNDTLPNYGKAYLDFGLKGSCSGDGKCTSFRKTFFETNSVDKTDYSDGTYPNESTSVTENWYERDRNLTVIRFPDSADGSTQNMLSISTLSDIQSSIQTYYNNYEMGSVNGHMSNPSESADEFKEQITIDAIKWYYDSYVSNSSRDARFATASELGYQTLARQTVTPTVEKNSSSELVLRYSTAHPRIYWTSVAVNKDVEKSSDWWVSYNNGSTWKSINMTRNQSNWRWFEIEFNSDTLLKSNKTVPNSAPGITSMKAIWNNIGGSEIIKLDVSIDDNGESDIKNYTAVPSGTTSVFTNSTLTIDTPSNPFDWMLRVADTSGLFSSAQQVNFTQQTNFFPYTENGTGAVNESWQTVNASSLVNVRGDAMKVEAGFVDPSMMKKRLRNGNISTGAVTGVQEFYSYWAVDHVEETIFAEGQDLRRTANTSKQPIYRKKEVYNNWSTNYSRLSVKPPTISGSCSNCNSRTVVLNGNSGKNLTYNASVDEISEKSYDFKPGVSAVTLDSNYTGRRVFEIENTGGHDFTGIETIPATPGHCGQSNNSAVALGSGVTKNLTIGFDCDPGTIGSPSSSTENISVNQTRYWYNTTDAEVYTNETEEIPIKLEFDQAQLTDFDNRDSGSLKAWADGKTGNVSVSTTVSNVVVTVGRNFGNSSWHQGTHSASITYTTTSSSSDSGDSDDGGSSGGGSTGGGGGFDDTDDTDSNTSNTTTGNETNVTLDSRNWTVSTRSDEIKKSARFYRGPGEVFEDEVFLKNNDTVNRSFTIRCASTDGACSWVTMSIREVDLEAGARTKFVVSGVLPANMSRSEQYTFRVEVEGSDGDVQGVDYLVTQEPALGILARTLGKDFEFSPPGSDRTVSGPVGVVAFLALLLVYAVMSLAERLTDQPKPRRGVKLLVSLFVFVMTIVTL